MTLGKVRSVDYYETLLKTNGTQPYQLLGEELRLIPDLTNASAVAKITYLALNATNPQVKEAFESMMIGGIPDPEDYGYSVPSYNTELEVLYWLACQNQFKKDDTLALSIAMVNGLWVTIGDEQVRAAVRNDTTDLLNFFRETDEMQSASGFHRLEEYPLEAKVALVWTGGLSVDVAKQFAASLYLQKPYPLTAYQWCVTSVDTLREMRKIIMENGWWQADVNKLENQLVDYFWYDGPHWVYTLHGGPSATITANGVNMTNWEYGSSNYIFWNQYMKTEIIYGVSYDFLPFIDSWLKSAGVASNDVWMTVAERPRYHNFNDFVIYYDPASGNWTAYVREIGDWQFGATPAEFILFRPPIHQQSYLRDIENQRENDINLSSGVNFDQSVYVDVGWVYCTMFGTSFAHGIPQSTGRDAVLSGIPSSQMGEWLLFAGKDPDSHW